MGNALMLEKVVEGGWEIRLAGGEAVGRFRVPETAVSYQWDLFTVRHLGMTYVLEHNLRGSEIMKDPRKQNMQALGEFMSTLADPKLPVVRYDAGREPALTEYGLEGGSSSTSLSADWLENVSGQDGSWRIDLPAVFVGGHSLESGTLRLEALLLLAAVAILELHI